MNEEVKQESDAGLVTKFKDLIKKAAEDGADPAQLAQLKSMWRQQTDWHPTKKKPNKATRIAKRKVAKQARKRNRNTSKGLSIQKGIHYTKQ